MNGGQMRQVKARQRNEGLDGLVEVMVVVVEK